MPSSTQAAGREGRKGRGREVELEVEGREKGGEEEARDGFWAKFNMQQRKKCASISSQATRRMTMQDACGCVTADRACQPHKVTHLHTCRR